MHSLLRAGVKNAGVAAALFSTVLNPLAPLTANAENSRHKPISPIQHVIVIVGENRSFDHLFATYVPKSGETVNNLLSEGIVNADGTPGSHYSRATQYSADITGSTTFQMAPSNKKPYLTLPAPLAGGPTNVCDNNGMCNLGDAMSSEDGLPTPPAPYYLHFLCCQSGAPLLSNVAAGRLQC